MDINCCVCDELFKIEHTYECDNCEMNYCDECMYFGHPDPNGYLLEGSYCIDCGEGIDYI